MEHDQTSRDHIKELVREESWAELSRQLLLLHPADVADIIDGVPAESRDQVFALLDDDAKPDVLAELEAAAELDVMEALTDAELSDIVEEMAPDDAADVLADLPEERSEQVLDLMESEESEEVRKLLEYDEDTAGGIMTTDVVSMKEDQTVQAAIDAIAYFELEEGEPFVYAYIVDAQERLMGFIDIWNLLRERNKQRPLRDLVNKTIAVAQVGDDQEEVARLMNQYDVSTMPVVDDHGVLVGRVTVDDVIDVMEEEASEDIFHMAGSDDSELDSSSPWKSCAARLPWLFVTLVGGFFTSLILRSFHAHISHMIILAAFVPIVLAMGGNTGIQASTLIVRRIALGTLGGHRVLTILLREMAVGAIMGCICGVAIGAWAHVLASVGTNNSLPAMHLAAIVAIALFSAMSFAAVSGAFVPITLHRLKIDPAVASGPFITIANDISALLIYFAVTLLLTHALT